MKLVLLLLAVSAQGLPPTLDGIQQVGCNVQEIGGAGISHGWHTRVWAQYADHRWVKLLTIRDDRHKALADCDRWMDALKKAAHHGAR